MRYRNEILLTGITGLIGGEIGALLSEEGYRIWALVRGRDDTHATSRVVDRFRRGGRSVPSSIVPVRGDISEEDLGIRDRDALKSIRANCRAIVHSAGATSFRSDRTCHHTNVEGARRIIKESRTWVNEARLLYLSTSYVCSSPRHCEINEDMPREGYANGYITSKRIAEDLFCDSHLESVVLRPSIVVSRGVGDRRFARSVLWFIPAAVKLGMIPLCEDCRVDIVPVEYIVACVLRLLKRNVRSGCYHLTAGKSSSVGIGEIRDAVFDYTGRSIECVPLASWNAMKEGGTRSACRLMTAMEYYIPFLSSGVVYSPDKLRSLLGPDMPDCSPFTEYCGDLLGLIDQKEAIKESWNP